MSRVLTFWIAMMFIFAGAMVIWRVSQKNSPASPQSVTVSDVRASVEPATTAGEFELMDQTGRRVNSSEYDGEVWAASFFFSRCPSKCYQQNIMLQKLDAKYADEGLKLVSITCDPGFDTPVVLAGYATRFNASPQTWKFLTPPDGDGEYVSQLGEQMGIAVDADRATHTDRVVLYDRNGNVQGSFSVMDVDQFNELDTRIGQLVSKSSEVTEITSDDATTPPERESSE